MNIPLMLDLGKNITEYLANTADHRALCAKVNTAFPAEDLQGHKPCCTPTAQTKLGYHGSFLRTKLIDTNGQCHQLPIHRVHCPLCKQTWSVYPSWLVPHKHYDAYVVQNVLEDVLSHELTYRNVTRQQHQLTSDGTAKPNQFRDARTAWHWVQWLGQFPLPCLLLTLGLLPPDYAVEDEKFLCQNGEKSYVLGLVDHQTELLWWLDYLSATDQSAIETSLRTFLNLVLEQTGQVHTFVGITSDDWTAARNAFSAINPTTQLAQCALHPFLKFQTVLARFVRQTKTTPERAAWLRTAFCQVVFAPDAASWQTALAALEQIAEFSHPLLAERLESLKRKREGLCLHYQDPNLAVTSSAIDRKFQRLERKFSSMQQFRTDESGKATLNAWAIVHNFRRYGSAAKRQGKSPVELAGVELAGQAWLQYLMLKLSQMYWLKPKPVPQLTQF